jgi:hypothetical protein
MDNMLLKYNSLDPEAKKQVQHYIDMMVARMKKPKKNQSSYKEKLLSVSVWSENDLKPIMDNHAFNQFKPEEW